MPVVTLPDGSQRTFDAPVTVLDVAADIGAGLAKAALAGVVDGRSGRLPCDLAATLTSEYSHGSRRGGDGNYSPLYVRILLAQAVQQLFPGTQVTIGPTVEDGFYYDFASMATTLRRILRRSRSVWRRLPPTDDR